MGAIPFDDYLRRANLMNNKMPFWMYDTNIDDLTDYVPFAEPPVDGETTRPMPPLDMNPADYLLADREWPAVPRDGLDGLEAE